MAKTIDEIREQSVDNTDEVIGSGFEWPAAIDDDGTVKVASGVNHIESCIKRIAMYNKGDLPSLYDFGANLRDKLFSPMVGSVIEEIRETLKSNIETFEKRVSDTRIIVGKTDDKSISVVAQYKVNTTGDFTNVVLGE